MHATAWLMSTLVLRLTGLGWFPAIAISVASVLGGVLLGGVLLGAALVDRRRAGPLAARLGQAPPGTGARRRDVWH